MNVNISIDGVLRNTIEKIKYHYNDYYLEGEALDTEEVFEYKIIEPVKNDNLLNYFKFQSSEEYEHFIFIEFPLEIFGHAKPSYPSVFSDLNKLIYNNKNINFTVVGVDELSKAKPATLFFLSKNNFLGNNVKFITTDKLKKEWKKCDIWITDNENILNSCPKNKLAVKFNTIFNEHISNNLQINNLTQIEEICSKFLENTTSSTSIQLPKTVKQVKE